MPLNGPNHLRMTYLFYRFFKTFCLLVADKSNQTPHDLTHYMVLPPQQKMQILHDLSGGLRRNLYGISVYIVHT
jgi:hypothetical protein